MLEYYLNFRGEEEENIILPKYGLSKGHPQAAANH